MRRGDCAFEERVLRACRTGGDSGPDRSAEQRALASHLASCPSCRQVARVCAGLALLARQGPGVELPDAHQLFWRARVLERFAERQQAERRAARPLDAVRWLAALLGAVVASVVVVQVLLETAAPGAAAAGGVAPLAASVFPFALWLGVALLAGALAMGFYALGREG